MIKKVFVSIGPIGYVAVALVMWIILRDIFKKPPDDGVSVDTLITGIREAGSLKPYKVIASGFGEVAHTNENGKTAKLEFQYKGLVEFSVDLRSISVSTNDGCIVIALNKPTMENPIALPLKGPRLWRVSTQWGMGEWKKKFRVEFGQIEAAAIANDACGSDHTAKAQKQTERILRLLLSPTVADPEKNIDFNWR